METPFGEEARVELSSPRNGILMSTVAERLFDSGLLAIVPRIDGLSSAEELEARNTTPVKEYKIRAIRPDDTHIQSQVVPGQPRRWINLDNEPVEFRSDYCPRARCLYHAYAVAILPRALDHDKKPVALDKTFGERYWVAQGHTSAKQCSGERSR